MGREHGHVRGNSSSGTLRTGLNTKVIQFFQNLVTIHLTNDAEVSVIKYQATNNIQLLNTNDRSTSIPLKNGIQPPNLPQFLLAKEGKYYSGIFNGFQNRPSYGFLPEYNPMQSNGQE
jgi:hypothetical protein